MKKSIKIWLITAASLMLAGIILFAGVMTMLKWDFKKLSTQKYIDKEQEINESYQGIVINVRTADIEVLPSDSETTTVKAHYESKHTYNVTVKDGNLYIEFTESKKWYDWIGIGFDSTKITVYVPQSLYVSLTVNYSTGDLTVSDLDNLNKIDASGSTGDVTISNVSSKNMKLKASTGNVTLNNVTASSIDITTSTGDVNIRSATCSGSINISLSTGDTTLSGVRCKNFSTSGNTGDVILQDLIANENLSIERSTGDVTFNACDASSINVNTSTGNVKGTLCSNKIFNTKATTGNVDVPESISGGLCHISTTTGDINIKILN